MLAVFTKLREGGALIAIMTFGLHQEDAQNAGSVGYLEAQPRTVKIFIRAFMQPSFQKTSAVRRGVHGISPAHHTAADRMGCMGTAGDCLCLGAVARGGSDA